MAASSIRLTSILAAAVADHIVGFFFYTIFFGKIWFEAMCVDKGSRTW